MTYFSHYVREILSISDKPSLNGMVEKLVEIIQNHRGLIFVLGNGGSSAIGEHFVTDLSRASNVSGEPVKAMFLGSNTSLLTADANDFGYAEVFSRQVRKFGGDGNILVAISSSGNSPNIISAILTARKLGLLTLALTGFDGGEASKISDVSIHVATENGAYEHVEDVHAMICHFVAMRLRERI